MRTLNKRYVPGRSNLALTIFVPYDCPNNCPFCSSKEEYRDKSSFSLDAILMSINKVAPLRQIQDIVITGGEPFADLEQLQAIVDTCKVYNKHLYINTTLPVFSEEEKGNGILNFLIANQRYISGLNISRHMCLKTNFEDDDFIYDLYHCTKLSLRINSVLLGVEAETNRVVEFIERYKSFVNSISFRGDYTKIKDQNDLRGLDHPLLDILFSRSDLQYLGSGGCLVCNNNDFISDNGVMISLHRGYEHSCVHAGSYDIINDIIIKQDGRILCDWDGEELDLENLQRQWNQ